MDNKMNNGIDRAMEEEGDKLLEKYSPKYEDVDDALINMESKIEQLQAELKTHRWVPAGERLPKKASDTEWSSDWVRVFVSEHGIHFDAWYDFQKAEWRCQQDISMYEITHYQLIILPKGK